MVCAKSGFWRLRSTKKKIFFKSILGTTTFFARPSGDFRYNNRFFFSCSSGDFRYNNFFFSCPSGDFRYNDSFLFFRPSVISQVKKACGGDLSKVKSCVKLTGFVNSTEDFIEQPKVINGASDLIVSVFGDSGMHTRAAVSTNSLPLGVSVEVDAIFELN